MEKISIYESWQKRYWVSAFRFKSKNILLPKQLKITHILSVNSRWNAFFGLNSGHIPIFSYSGAPCEVTLTPIYAAPKKQKNLIYAAPKKQKLSLTLSCKFIFGFYLRRRFIWPYESGRYGIFSSRTFVTTTNTYCIMILHSLLNKKNLL